MKEPLERAKATQATVQELCAQLRAAATAVVAARREAGAAGQVSGEAVKAPVSRGSLALIDLKRCNRDLHLLMEESDKAALPRKAEVDAQHLQLQNFLYEQQQYQASIHACTHFTSRHTTIPLVPLPEYFASHPANRGLEKSDPHRLLLHRLNFELAERQKGETALQKLVAERAQVKDSRRSSEQFLEGLRDSLKGVKDSTKPLQEFLKVPARERQKEHRKATLLPPPLYVLYQKWAAFAAANAKEGITVKIVGHKSGVEAFTATIQRRLEEGVLAGDGPPDTKRRRMSSPSRSASPPPTVALTEPHPLAVELGFELKEGAGEAAVALRFHFLPLLNHITVELSVARKAPSPFNWIPDVTVLRNLIPDDDGRTPPNPATAYAAMEAEAPATDAHRLPFKWAQWLAGYDFMFPLPPHPPTPLDPSRPVGQLFTCRHRQGPTRVFRLLRARLLARLSLCRQVELLKKGQAGAPVLKADPGKWQVLEPVKLVGVEELPSAPPLDEGTVLRAYQLTLKGGAHAFKATLALPENYPDTLPLLTLACTTRPAAAMPFPAALREKADPRALDLLRQCSQEAPTLNGLKQIEYEVNYNLQSYCTAPLEGDRLSLVRQIQLLLRCLDIFVHAQAGRSDRLALRETRGRNRALPLHWNAALKMFEH